MEICQCRPEAIVAAPASAARRAARGKNGLKTATVVAMLRTFTSPLLRRYVLDRGGKFRVRRRVDRLVLHRRARWTRAQVSPRPVLRRPVRPRHEPAAAIRADVP